MGAPITYPFNGRRVNPDGTIDIKCRICEKTICREPYRKFSTAICAVCYGEIEKGKTPEEILAQVKAQEDAVGRGIIDDLGPTNFKVIGLGTRIKEVVEKVRKAATARRRSPLFEKKDEIK